jgi:hypothetical protein
VLSGLQLHQMALWVRCGAKEAAASRRAQVHANDRFRLLRALELEQLGRAHGPVAVATAARAVDEVGLGLLRRLAALGSVVLVVLCLLGWPPRRATPKPITPAHYSAQAARAAGLRTQAWDYRFAFVHRERTELYHNAERRCAPRSGPPARWTTHSGVVATACRVRRYRRCSAGSAAALTAGKALRWVAERTANQL